VIAKGEQERNPKMMIFSSDAEQMRAHGMILLVAFAGRDRMGSMWWTTARPAVLPVRQRVPKRSP
jgi:hypothetical protein